METKIQENETILEKFIKMQYQNLGNDRKILMENKEIQTLENKFSELLDKIKELDKTLVNETDVLIGNMVSAYQMVYFKKGFIDGLILAQEIQQLLFKSAK